MTGVMPPFFQYAFTAYTEINVLVPYHLSHLFNIHLFILITLLSLALQNGSFNFHIQ